jgi:hypothetical protein
MSGGKGRGRGRGGRGRGRGSSYSGTGAAAAAKHKGLCSALGNHVFDYGQKAAADQMRTTWEKIVHHAGTIYGHDISNELLNKKTVVIQEPAYTPEVLEKHKERVLRNTNQQERLQLARYDQQVAFEAAVADGDAEASMKLAILENDIEEATFQGTVDLPIKLDELEKTHHENEWRTFRERNSRLEKQRGQAFSMIRGQCMQVLLDKMKHDPDWTTTSESYDPLTLLKLIEKTVLAQTEDQYPFATVYEQECALYSFSQQNLTNEQWYERFNTKIDVGSAIGVTRQHRVLLEHVATEIGTIPFSGLSASEQHDVREKAEERYLSYVFLRQSGKQHNKLKVDLQNDFTTGDDRYPKNRQATLHLLDKYSKSTVSNTTSEGTAFAQRGGRTSETFDQKYWKDKECYHCNKKGHPSTHCPDKKKKSKSSTSSSKTTEDDASRSSKSSKSSVKSITKMQKKLKKSFATMQSKIEELDNDNSDLTDSESDDEETSHFQFQTPTCHPFQGVRRTKETAPHKTPGVKKKEAVSHEIAGVPATRGLVFHQAFEKRNAEVLFKQTQWKEITLDLKNVILLDSQSTMDLFCNPELVKHVTKSSHKMRLQSNGGSMTVNHKATIEGYKKKVWFSKDAITNIIALSNLIQQYHVTYDSRDQIFVVHRETQNKPNMEFRMHESGLHYFDPSNEAYTFVNTVSGNKEGYTQRQIKGAESARILYAKLGYPSTKDYKWIVQSNQIKDCPVTVQDVDASNKIWGKNIAALKGKTTRTKPIHVARDFIKVPKELLQLHKEVFLTCDIFFVNKVPFFITLSRKICFTAVNHLANRKVKNIYKAFEEIYKFYLNRGFRITIVHADGEFAPLQALIQGMPMGPRVNLASSSEHVPEIERRIRVVKERCRSARHSLPFNRIPKLLTIHLVFNSVKLLNHFPVKGGISDTISPKTIMTGETLDYKKHLSLQLGQYCQVHEEDQPRNSQLPRTQGAICLGPSGNVQGGFKFMSLQTMKKIVRRSWDSIPMPDTVIARVNKLGKDEPEQFIFTDRSGRLIGDVELPGVDGVNNDTPHTIAPDDATIVEIHDLDNNPYEIDQDAVPTQEQEPQTIDTEPETVDTEVNGDPTPIPPVQAPEVQATSEAPVEITGVRRSTRAKSQKKDYVPSMSGNTYAFAVTQLETYGALHPDTHTFFQMDMQQAEPDVVAMIMTQLSLKAGLKRWGRKAEEAVRSEMKQLHFRDTFKPLHYHELTDAQKKTVLESHLFLKEKRDGKIKGRKVAGGNKQRDYISKEDASSPTVATESVLLSSIVDASEGRDVAVIDIPNAFIQTRIEDEEDMAIIKIRGILVNMLVEIAPEFYKPFVTTDKKGVKQLTVQCQNAIYGTMVASLLYYRKFCKSLTSIGFEFNPYDPCVANKMINGEQMTIAFHVDDCKLSHKDPKEMDNMIAWLKREYESIFEDGSGKMAVSRGKIHTYLGMTLDFTISGQVKVTMLDYVEEILKAFDEAEPKGSGTKTSAAPDNLFRVDDDCDKLGPEKAQMFHTLVAKTLYATKRARPDTCTAVAFLTTRVREPDTDDWAKMVHLMKYIRGTKTLPLILSARGSGILKWWIDGSFAVHPNMRGHTGGGLSMGRGFPIVNSTKQKLNTRSSTESEIVGVDDCMPAICWTRYFMDAQGYGIQENIVFQDNKSAILMEKNGKASSSKRTKHINIRYYFVTDRINKQELTVEWCPTGDMIGDYMTKPTQGALFKKFRDQIMGVIEAQDPGPGKVKVAKSKPLEQARDSKRKRKPLKEKRVRMILPGQKDQRQAHRSVLEDDAVRTKRTSTRNG